MRTPNDFYSHGGSARMKPGDRVIWLRSPRRFFLTGWRVQRIPAIVDRACRRRIRIRGKLGGNEKLIHVEPENLMRDHEFSD
jgi:hypothetical protein